MKDGLYTTASILSLAEVERNLLLICDRNTLEMLGCDPQAACAPCSQSKPPMSYGRIRDEPCHPVKRVPRDQTARKHGGKCDQIRPLENHLPTPRHAFSKDDNYVMPDRDKIFSPFFLSSFRIHVLVQSSLSVCFVLESVGCPINPMYHATRLSSDSSTLLFQVVIPINPRYTS